MAESFAKEIRVIEPECDISQKMSIASIMRHAQQMGSDHINRKGIDYNRMIADGLVFVVSKMRIMLHRRPTFGENLTLTTIPRKPKGVQFVRDTYFDTAEGDRLVEVSISWVLVDAKSHRILRPSAFDIYGFEMFPNDCEEITGYKLHRPEGQAVEHLRQVKFSDLDYNNHVNNAIYADMVLDALPADAVFTREPCFFGILYQKEATFRQAITLEVLPQDADGFYIGGTVYGERCFEAEIRFRPENA